jgi:hypothetical protein
VRASSYSDAETESRSADSKLLRGGSGSRPPNGHEHEVLDLRNMEGLNNVPFSERTVVDFVARMKRLIH